MRYIKVSDIEVQARRATSLMDDLRRIVPDVELQIGPLLKVCQTLRCVAEEIQLF